MRGIREWAQGFAQISPCGNDEKTRPPCNQPRVPDGQRNLARDPAHDGTRRDPRVRRLETLIEQDYPHSPRGRFAYGAP